MATVGNVFQDGAMIERSFTFGNTTVGALGDVSVSGTSLSIGNLAVYADSAGTVNLGTGAVLSMVNSLSSEAAADWFTSLTLSGLRYSGANVGNLVTITRTLTGP